MYTAFDSFLESETWHSLHSYNDEKHFYKALNKVIQEPDFHPLEMARYMRKKVGNNCYYRQAIDRFTEAASFVKSYLTANGL